MLAPDPISDAVLDNWSRVARIALVGFVFLTVLVRKFFGIDFTDEAFYSAMAVRFASGDVPFVDEYNLAQYPAFLMSGLLRLVAAVWGDPREACILGARLVFLLLMIGLAIAVYRTIRPSLQRGAAIAISCLPLVFAPYNIQSVSYITVGYALFAAGCFMALGSTEGKPNRRLLIAGVCHGLATTAYPPLIAALAFFACCVLLLNGLRSLSAYVSAAAFAGLPLALLILFAGPQQVIAAIQYASSVYAGNGPSQKVLNAYHEVAYHFPSGLLLLALLGVFLCVRYVPWRLAALAGASLPLLATITALTYKGMWTVSAYPTGAMYAVMFIAIISMPVVLLLARRAEFRRAVFFVWVPSVVAGTVMFWSSNTGARSAAAGLLGAAIIGLVALCKYASLQAERAALSLIWRSALTVGPALIMLLALMVHQYLQFFRDAPLWEQTAIVGDGAYRWLFTTAERARFIRLLPTDVAQFSAPHDRVLFFDDFPAGYIITRLRPATPTVWTFPMSTHVGVDRSVNESYYARTGVMPDLVVRMSGLPGLDDKLSYSEEDPLMNFVARNYASVLQRDYYTIFLKREKSAPK